MNRNRLKTPNTLQSRKVWKLFALCFIGTLFGLVYVFLQIKIIQLSDENGKQQAVLDEIRRKNAGLCLQVDKLKSPVVLERKVISQHLRMVPISSLTQYEARMPSQSNRQPGSLVAKRETYR